MSQKIIIEAFGMQNVVVKPYVIGAAKDSINLAGYAAYAGLMPKPNSLGDAAQYTSVLGTPVWDTLIIKAGSYVDYKGDTTTYNEMRIDNVLMTITQTDNVILTPIQGRDGEVIEYIGKGSFRINFKGGFFGSGNVRPKSDIVNFMLMMGSNQPLSVKYSGFLDEWNISEFVVLDKNIPQQMGGYNYQLFEFNAIQDIPVILAQAPQKK